MKNLVAIFGGHDANITFYNAETNKYYVIELERLVKKRYFRLHVDNPQEVQFDIFKQCQIIAEKNWGVKNAYMMAVAMAASLPVVLAYIIFQRKITQAIMLTSGIKG